MAVSPYNPTSAAAVADLSLASLSAQAATGRRVGMSRVMNCGRVSIRRVPVASVMILNYVAIFISSQTEGNPAATAAFS